MFVCKGPTHISICEKVVHDFPQFGSIKFTLWIRKRDMHTFYDLLIITTVIIACELKRKDVGKNLEPDNTQYN